MFAALGGLIETPLAPKQVPIDFQTVDGDHRVTVAGLLEMKSEPIPNPAPDQPPLDVQVANSASPLFIGSVKSRRSGVMKLTDPELKFDHSGQSALTGEFDFKGP